MKVLRIVLVVIGVFFAGPAITATVAIVTGFNCTDHPKAMLCADDADRDEAGPISPARRTSPSP